MSETAVTHVGEPTRQPGSKLAAVAGIASALSFLVGTAVLNVPTKATDSELVRWWSSSGHQREALISMIAMTLAGLLFVVFLAHLRSRLLTSEGGDGTLTTIVYSAGLLFVGMLFLAATARGVISFAIRSPAGEQPLPSVDLLRYLPQISVCRTRSLRTSLRCTRDDRDVDTRVQDGVFGRWLAWLGFVCAAALVAANVVLLGIAVVPAMLVWTIATSVVLGRSATTRGLATSRIPVPQ